MKTFFFSVRSFMVLLLTFMGASLYAQNCPGVNQVINPGANAAAAGWTTFGPSTAIATNPVSGNNVFTITAIGSHFYQDIGIPAASQNFCIAGGTRNSINLAAAGHPYLYAYIMDANNTILQYVQFSVNQTNVWVRSQQSGVLPAGATTVRLFLKRSSIAGVPDPLNNTSGFDNLKVSFN